MILANDLQIGVNPVQRAYIGNELVWYRFHAKTIDIMINASMRNISLPSWEYLIVLDRIIRDFVDCGFWDLLDTFYFFAGAMNSTKEFKCINWINPKINYGEFRGDLTNAFVANGLDGNISSSGYNPAMVYFITNRRAGESGKFTLNNASVGTLVFRQAVGIWNDVTAYIGLNTRTGVSMTPVTGNWQRLNATNSGGNINYLGTGFMVLNRISNTQLFGVNKTVQTTVNVTSTFVHNNFFSALHMGDFGTGAVQYNTNAGLTLMFTGQSISYSISQAVRTTMNEKYFRVMGLPEIA